MVTKTIQVRKFPEELIRTIKMEMLKRDMTLSEFLSAAVYEFLRKKAR